MHNHAPRASVDSVLPEVDALPGAEHEFAVLIGDRQRGGREHGLDVGGHVVRAFNGVGVNGVVFWHEAIEPLFQIVSCGGVGVLLNQEARRCMLDKYCAQPFGGLLGLHMLLERLANHVCDFVQPLIGDLNGFCGDHDSPRCVWVSSASRDHGSSVLSCLGVRRQFQLPVTVAGVFIRAVAGRP